MHNFVSLNYCLFTILRLRMLNFGFMGSAILSCDSLILKQAHVKITSIPL